MKIKTIEEAVAGRSKGTIVHWRTRPNGTFTESHKGEVIHAEVARHGQYHAVLDLRTFETIHVFQANIRKEG